LQCAAIDVVADSSAASAAAADVDAGDDGVSGPSVGTVSPTPFALLLANHLPAVAAMASFLVAHPSAELTALASDLMLTAARLLLPPSPPASTVTWLRVTAADAAMCAAPQLALTFFAIVLRSAFGDNDDNDDDEHDFASGDVASPDVAAIALLSLTEIFTDALGGVDAAGDNDDALCAIVADVLPLVDACIRGQSAALRAVAVSALARWLRSPRVLRNATVRARVAAIIARLLGAESDAAAAANVSLAPPSRVDAIDGLLLALLCAQQPQRRPRDAAGRLCASKTAALADSAQRLAGSDAKSVAAALSAAAAALSPCGHRVAVKLASFFQACAVAEKANETIVGNFPLFDCAALYEDVLALQPSLPSANDAPATIDDVLDEALLASFASSSSSSSTLLFHTIYDMFAVAEKVAPATPSPRRGPSGPPPGIPVGIPMGLPLHGPPSPSASTSHSAPRRAGDVGGRGRGAGPPQRPPPSRAAGVSAGSDNGSNDSSRIGRGGAPPGAVRAPLRKPQRGAPQLRRVASFSGGGPDAALCSLPDVAPEVPELELLPASFEPDLAPFLTPPAEDAAAAISARDLYMAAAAAAMAASLAAPPTKQLSDFLDARGDECVHIICAHRPPRPPQRALPAAAASAALPPHFFTERPSVVRAGSTDSDTDGGGGGGGGGGGAIVAGKGGRGPRGGNRRGWAPQPQQVPHNATRSDSGRGGGGGDGGGGGAAKCTLPSRPPPSRPGPPRASVQKPKRAPPPPPVVIHSGGSGRGSGGGSGAGGGAGVARLTDFNAMLGAVSATDDDDSADAGAGADGGNGDAGVDAHFAGANNNDDDDFADLGVIDLDVIDAKHAATAATSASVAAKTKESENIKASLQNVFKVAPQKVGLSPKSADSPVDAETPLLTLAASASKSLSDASSSVTNVVVRSVHSVDAELTYINEIVDEDDDDEFLSQNELDDDGGDGGDGIPDLRQPLYRLQKANKAQPRPDSASRYGRHAVGKTPRSAPSPPATGGKRRRDRRRVDASPSSSPEKAFVSRSTATVELAAAQAQARSNAKTSISAASRAQASARGDAHSRVSALPVAAAASDRDGRDAPRRRVARNLWVDEDASRSSAAARDDSSDDDDDDDDGDDDDDADMQIDVWPGQRESATILQMGIPHNVVVEDDSSDDDDDGGIVVDNEHDIDDDDYDFDEDDEDGDDGYNGVGLYNNQLDFDDDDIGGVASIDIAVDSAPFDATRRALLQRLNALDSRAWHDTGGDGRHDAKDFTSSAQRSRFERRRFGDDDDDDLGDDSNDDDDDDDDAYDDDEHIHNGSAYAGPPSSSARWARHVSPPHAATAAKGRNAAATLLAQATVAAADARLLARARSSTTSSLRTSGAYAHDVAAASAHLPIRRAPTPVPTLSRVSAAHMAPAPVSIAALTAKFQAGNQRMRALLLAHSQPKN
jgi:hypothetical protein